MFVRRHWDEIEPYAYVINGSILDPYYQSKVIVDGIEYVSLIHYLKSSFIKDDKSRADVIIHPYKLSQVRYTNLTYIEYLKTITALIDEWISQSAELLAEIEAIEYNCFPVFKVFNCDFYNGLCFCDECSKSDLGYRGFNAIGVVYNTLKERLWKQLDEEPYYRF